MGKPADQLPPQDYLATMLINEINQLPEPFILVLDDCQWIEDQGVHQLLTALATSRSRPMHMVLASRTEPPLPFARLRAGRKMEELRVQDLRFTTDEAKALLAASSPVSRAGRARVPASAQTSASAWILLREQPAPIRLACLGAATKHPNHSSATD